MLPRPPPISPSPPTCLWSTPWSDLRCTLLTGEGREQITCGPCDWLQIRMSGAGRRQADVVLQETALSNYSRGTYLWCAAMTSASFETGPIHIINHKTNYQEKASTVIFIWKLSHMTCKYNVMKTFDRHVLRPKIRIQDPQDLATK